jgi:hypothetical protein
MSVRVFAAHSSLSAPMRSIGLVFCLPSVGETPALRSARKPRKDQCRHRPKIEPAKNASFSGGESDSKFIAHISLAANLSLSSLKKSHKSLMLKGIAVIAELKHGHTDCFGARLLSFAQPILVRPIWCGLFRRFS